MQKMHERENNWDVLEDKTFCHDFLSVVFSKYNCCNSSDNFLVIMNGWKINVKIIVPYQY